MSQRSEQNSGSSKQAAKGTEVFVGGLARTVTEDKIRQVFSSCGEIMEVRLLKDPKGVLKGFGFVRFATKEAANRAISEKSGTMMDGKKIGVLASTEQNSLYLGNLNKAWGADEFEQFVLQVFSDVESIDLAMLKDVQPGQKQKNRGFGFVRFSTHAAASRAQRVASQPDFRLGNLHPAVKWAEEEPEVDPQELSEIKVAFVRSLPSDTDENFLKQLFEPFGKVEKVVVSKKGSFPVGFVHFYERSDLEQSIKALHDKQIRGPRGGSVHKLQVEVARPFDKTKKRARDTVESSLPVQGQSKHLKEQPTPNVLPITSHSSLVQKHGIEPTDPYEDAVVALPLAVKERLLRILRLGIATRFDIDVNTLRCLKELPESIAISVLDQFMLSGSSSQNKGVYLAELISKYLADKLGLGPSLANLSRAAERGMANDLEPFSYSPRVSPRAVAPVASHARPAVPRSDMYPLQNASSFPDYPLSSRGRLDEQLDYLRPNRALSGSQILMGSRQELNVPDYLLSNRAISGSRILTDRVEDGSDILMHRMGRVEERIRSPFESTAGLPYGRAGVRVEEQPYMPPRDELPSSSTSYGRHGISLGSDVPAVADRQAARPQMRFDPYTGEPYKFDPFTGEPIRPESGSRQF